MVNIHGQKTLPPDDPHSTQGARHVNGMGTGVVIDRRGYILTNHHVIDGVSRIQITTAENETVVGNLIARDEATDLAVIKVPADPKFEVIRVGTSRDLMVGEPVVAMGNAFGYNHSVTRGIISSLHRDVPISDTQKYFDLIQTDASINPGNSGGPLLNVDGEMIGLNVAVRVGAQGIGFAIPVDQALEVAARMMRSHNEQRHWHGVATKSVIDEGKPALKVTAIAESSPAEKAGLEVGDIITEVGDRPVSRLLDFELALVDGRVGDELTITARRDGNSRTLSVLIDEARQGAVSQVAAKVWAVTGLQLTPVGIDEIHRRSDRYRGGLRVTAVRPDSPADRQNIKAGDVLVGMHVWETVSLENLGYVMGQDEFEKGQPVKCYILREDRTHYTYLPVAGRTLQ